MTDKKSGLSNTDSDSFLPGNHLLSQHQRAAIVSDLIPGLD